MRQTKLKLLLTSPHAEKERELARKWADIAACNGGDVSAETAWTSSDWYIIWTINWPDHVTIPEGAVQ